MIPPKIANMGKPGISLPSLISSCSGPGSGSVCGSGSLARARLALVEHIQDMWDYAPTKTKQKTRAQLMFLKDSGIRISDLANLNLEDYVDTETIEVNGEKYKRFWPTETEKTAEIAHIHARWLVPKLPQL